MAVRYYQCSEDGVVFNSVCLWVCLFVRQCKNSRTVWNIIVKFLGEQDIIYNSDEFKNGCIPIHWRIQGWHEDLRYPLDNLGCTTVARMWWSNVSDVLVIVVFCTRTFRGATLFHFAWNSLQSSVADDIPLRAEDCTFSVVVWQWLGDRDCTAQYNCRLPVTTDCRHFCHFFVFFCFV